MADLELEQADEFMSIMHVVDEGSGVMFRQPKNLTSSSGEIPCLGFYDEVRTNKDKPDQHQEQEFDHCRLWYLTCEQ